MATVVLALFGAMIIGETARPAVDRLSTRVAPPAAVAIVFGTLFAVLALLGLVPLRLLAPQILAFLSVLPGYAAKAAGALGHIPLPVEQLASFARTLFRDSLGIVPALSTLALTLVMAMFWLGASTPLAAFILTLLPPNRRDDASSIFSEMGAKLGAYVGGTLTNAVIVASASSVLLVALNFPYPIALGLLQGAMVTIPYLGTFIGVATAAIVVFAAQGPLRAGEAAALLALTQTIEGSFVAPLIFKKHVDVDPLGCVVATASGGVLFGIPGVVLAVPAASVVKTLAVRIVAPAIRRHFVAALVGLIVATWMPCSVRAADTALTGDQILARCARADGVAAYSVPMHFDVHMHKPIGAKGAVDGVAYYKAPAQAALVITKAPPLIGGFFKGSYNVDLVPQAWPAKYHVTSVSTGELNGTTIYVLRAVPTSPGTLDHVLFRIAQSDFSPMSAEWLYADNSFVRLSFANKNVGKLILPRTAKITVEMPHYGLAGDATYGDYVLDASFPDSVFVTK